MYDIKGKHIVGIVVGYFVFVGLLLAGAVWIIASVWQWAVA